MADYAKMKNAELEALLKSRNLPHTGKKADMVSRLIEADKKTTESPSTTTAAAAEDEIDWDDDTDATRPAAAAEAAATAIKAGSKGPVANPQAVPNQVADVDPSKTSDLSVKPPAENKNAEGSKSEEAKPEKPAVDFTRGLAASTLEDEIEKRKARAKKFGMPAEEDETLKKLERAKKFGEMGAPRGLDEALPERAAGRKRGHEGGDEGGRGGHNKRGGRRLDGRRGGDRRARDGDRKPRDNKREQRKSLSGGKAGWMNETDKAKAEARKAKFATPAALT